jgi:integral membrane protein (TIGR01906 family)
MKELQKVLSWFVTILLPVALTFIGFRFVLTHTFLKLEYHMPGFPPDNYGFSLQDRIHWSQIAWDYLLKNADISYLGDLKFADGSPLYNIRELSHMQDAKNVVQPSLLLGYSVCFILLLLAIWARWGGWWPKYVQGIWRGGWLTVGIMAVIGIFALISFWQFFTFVHELFFTGDSWLFLYSDTLIRLFPMRFWQDAFLFPGIVDVLGGLALGLGLRPKPN